MVGLGREPDRAWPSPFGGHGLAWQGGQGWGRGSGSRGCARTQVASVCGTPGFMAPEVVMERPYGLQADIYSWGMCVLSLDQGIANPPTALEQQRAVGMSMQHVCNTSPLPKF